ncbi:MAG: glycoside hydrolase family 2 protein [Treponema sp.]|jgi:beta-mannosidase|nr:glycoside hydrolase family 2 protein [Treponema sp.]
MFSLGLDGTWQLSSCGKPVNAEVPGSVLDTWIKAGHIPDPFYGENEKTITPLFDNNFEYSRTFSVSEELLAEDTIDLVCLGIDTLGEIFINGESVSRVDNMHRSWRFNVKRLLKPGENSIRIVLFSPVDFITKSFNNGRVRYISTGGMAGQGYLRKAHCQFGWDWGPQLPDAGIWRSIFLEGWSARLADVYVIQEHSNSSVTLRVKVKTAGESRPLKAELRVTPPGNSETLTVTENINGSAELTLVIEKPELWQPNGLISNKGAQPLYNVEVALLDNDSVLDSWRRRIGLRTLTYSAEKDQWGREFAMTVNGIKVFSMGADYIPEDSCFPRINKERTRRLLEDCVKANFNSIRVWGGGYYPDDYFYDICDELGLVVWQDFMFACNIYELTDDFAETVAEEIRRNVIRIRHHPCLGLWCGNNEMEIAWFDWPGVCSHHPALKADYIKLFEGLIPNVLKETDPQTFYWPSSPSSGGSFDAPNDFDRGDVHYWEVWHGQKPFKDYRKYFFRYCSEFGFQSLPDIETIQSFAKPEDLNLFSPVMEAHQRNPGGNGKILFYISETYRYPKDFASLVYISQVLQLESIQTGVDHWRRNRGRCMGAIYWQLNDCWPVTSWASIDYYGRWKALHYGARRFFAPLRATVFIDETEPAKPGSLTGSLRRTARVFVHNDTVKSAEGILSLFLKDRDFNILAEETINVKLPALSAGEVMVRDYRDIINTVELERSCFVTVQLKINGVPVSSETTYEEIVSNETALFVPPKHFSFNRPNYSVDVSDSSETDVSVDHFTITVKADTFCRFARVKIKGEDPVFSDNYFDITGKEGVEIQAAKNELKKNYTAQTLKASLDDIISVGDSF